MRLAIAAAVMTPADQAIQEPEAPFSIRRRQRGGRRVVAVSSSVSAMDALRARIRAQSKKVADHIATEPEAQGFIDDWATPSPTPWTGACGAAPQSQQRLQEGL